VCNALAFVEFEEPSSLRRIGFSAFSWCAQLSSIFLPASVEIVDGSPFPHSGLTEIALDESNSSLSICDRFLANAEGSSLIHYIGIESEVIVPSEFVELAAACFAGCDFLATVRFESGSQLRNINKCAFYCCPQLVEAAIPASTQKLGKACFSMCRALARVVFDRFSSLRIIEKSAFSGCAALRTISIPASVEVVGWFCFQDCDALQVVTFESPSKLKHLGPNAFPPYLNLRFVGIPATAEIEPSDL
jgi:hypothetical protein